MSLGIFFFMCFWVFLSSKTRTISLNKAMWGIFFWSWGQVTQFGWIHTEHFSLHLIYVLYKTIVVFRYNSDFVWFPQFKVFDNVQLNCRWWESCYMAWNLEFLLLAFWCGMRTCRGLSEVFFPFLELLECIEMSAKHIYVLCILPIRNDP